MPRDIDQRIVEIVYGFTARMYRDALGDTLYIVDDRADKERGTAFLIGASWQRGYDASGALVEFYGRICPAYSEDIGAAWGVVEALRQKGWRVSISEVTQFDWNCRFTPADTSQYVYKLAPTAPLAICQAALDVPIDVWRVEGA